jgi:hypothetical protein
MILKTGCRLATATLLTAALGLSLADSASAAPPEPVEPFEITLPAGVGCAEFDLTVSATAGKLRTVEFVDEAGQPVRVISVGTGISYTYTNETTNESITTKASGSATSTVTNPDGTLTVTATGHNGLILFPTDVPAGPTATAYRGKIVYNVDPATGVFTLLSTTGASLDICAELS